MNECQCDNYRFKQQAFLNLEYLRDQIEQLQSKIDLLEAEKLSAYQYAYDLKRAVTKGRG